MQISKSGEISQSGKSLCPGKSLSPANHQVRKIIMSGQLLTSLYQRLVSPLWRSAPPLRHVSCSIPQGLAPPCPRHRYPCWMAMADPVCLWPPPMCAVCRDEIVPGVSWPATSRCVWVCRLFAAVPPLLRMLAVTSTSLVLFSGSSATCHRLFIVARSQRFPRYFACFLAVFARLFCRSGCPLVSHGVGEGANDRIALHPRLPY